jgi:hypothetical protein
VVAADCVEHLSNKCRSIAVERSGRSLSGKQGKAGPPESQKKPLSL